MRRSLAKHRLPNQDRTKYKTIASRFGVLQMAVRPMRAGFPGSDEPKGRDGLWPPHDAVRRFSSVAPSALPTEHDAEPPERVDARPALSSSRRMRLGHDEFRPPPAISGGDTRFRCTTHRRSHTTDRQDKFASRVSLRPLAVLPAACSPPPHCRPYPVPPPRPSTMRLRPTGFKQSASARIRLAA